MAFQNTHLFLATHVETLGTVETCRLLCIGSYLSWSRLKEGVKHRYLLSAVFVSLATVVYMNSYEHLRSWRMFYVIIALCYYLMFKRFVQIFCNSLFYPNEASDKHGSMQQVEKHSKAFDGIPVNISVTHNLPLFYAG